MTAYTDFMLDYIYLNPDMLYAPELSVQSAIPRATMSTYRSNRRATYEYRSESPIMRTRLLLPLCPDSGRYYHELGLPCCDVHAASQFYIFHAFAWARWRWAGILSAVMSPTAVCPFSPDKLTAAGYRRDFTDADDTFGGTAYLTLAQRFLRDNISPILRLPCPATVKSQAPDKISHAQLRKMILAEAQRIGVTLQTHVPRAGRPPIIGNTVSYDPDAVQPQPDEVGDFKVPGVVE